MVSFEAPIDNHELLRPVRAYQQMTTHDQIRKRVTKLHKTGHTASQIAQCLNQEGYSPPRRNNPFRKEHVWPLLRRYGLTQPRDVVELAPHEWSISDLAQKLAVPISRLRNWATKGWVHARQTPIQGRWILWANPQDLKRLTQLTASSKLGVPSHPAKLTTPHLKK